MIRKLRIKFMAVAMCSFALVLLLVLGVINTLNYQDVVNEADAILSILKFNSGEFPDFKEALDGATSDDMAPPDWDFPPRLSSPEAPFENRFFSVIFGGDGGILMTDTRQIAAIDETMAAEYAQRVRASGNESGGLGDYRYATQTLDNGDTIIVFLDCGRNLSSFRSYLRTSALLYVCALAAVFTMLALLSGRIVRPISESYEKQKQFVTNAGHDIKTPLTIINADAEVLGMDLGDNEWVQDIKAQTGQLAVLTRDLISLSKMEEPQAIKGAARQMIEFPFSDMVSELAQSFQSLARMNGKSLVCDIQPMLSIYGDEKALRQLVSILLDNALKYSKGGSAINLRLERKARSVLLSARNACEPITQEQLSHLFDRFYRIDTSRTPDGGYGIGLSIAKAVAEAHRGRIQARSRDGHSLTVSVTLPAGKKLSSQ